MKTLQGIAVAVLTSTLVACALDSANRGGNVTIRIAAPNRGASVPVVMVSASPAPTSISAFSCIGVNVSGPGIPDTSRNPEPNLPLLFDRLLRRESYCSYRGIIKGPISATATTDQEISLVVPPGAPRLIQVIGIIEKNGSNDCQAEFIPGVLPAIGPSGTPLEGDAYELGRAVVDLFQDQTISITMDYNTLLTDADRAVRELKCGNGSSPTPSGVPTTLLAPTSLTIPAAFPTHIATGGGHVCGIFGASGTVYCRGANTMGQLGDGTFTDSASFIPTSVSGALMVATGNAFSCALLSGGSVKCWGAGTVGQLGNGSGTNSSTPVMVTGISTTSSIAAGGSHACARSTSNDLYCWGLNSSGQLGDGTTTNRLTPVSVSGTTGQAFGVSLGLSHSCMAASASVMCWGAGSLGQLGTGGSSSSLTPVTATGVSGSINSLAAGENHSCAIVSGTLYCWGSNASGQIGNGGGANVLTPVTVSIGGPSIITAGKDFSCVKDGSSALYCWGVGPMLGNGTTVGSPSPTGVGSLTSNISQVYPASISGTVCVSLADGTAKCWGNNSFGQISP